MKNEANLGAARAERSLLQFCRVATRFNEVNEE
jgi:hypothetical protein